MSKCFDYYLVAYALFGTCSFTSFRLVIRLLLFIPFSFARVGGGTMDEVVDATYVSWLFWQTLYERNEPFRLSSPDGVADLLSLDVTKVELSLRGIVGVLAPSLNAALVGLAATLRDVCGRVPLLVPTVITLTLSGDTDEQGFSLLCTISVGDVTVTRRFRESTLGTLPGFACEFLNENFKIPLLTEGNGHDCAICLVSMTGQCILTECKHMFHLQCLANLQRYSSSCPLCRSALNMGDLTLFTRS